jgi:hypothetical protein
MCQLFTHGFWTFPSIPRAQQDCQLLVIVRKWKSPILPDDQGSMAFGHTAGIHSSHVQKEWEGLRNTDFKLISEIQSHLLTSLVGLTWVLRYFSKQPGVVQPSSSQRSQQWQRSAMFCLWVVRSDNKKKKPSSSHTQEYLAKKSNTNFL